MVQSCLGPLPVFKVYKIAPEIPPTLTVDDLDRQSETVTPSSLNANFDTIPSSKKHDRPTAKLRARVLSTHTGVVLPEHYELIAGGVGDGVKPLLNRTDFGRLSTEIFSERFGKSSFLVQWATGESATEEFIWVKRNWSIERQFHSIPPSGPEDPVALIARQQKIAEYSSAIRKLDRTWHIVYTDNMYDAADEAYKATGIKRRVWENKKMFFKSKKDSPPGPGLDVSLLTSRRMCEAARTTPLHNLTRKQRLDFWKSKISADILTSTLEHSSGAVDLRRLVGTDPQTFPERNGTTRRAYQTLWTDRLTHILDTLNTLVIRPAIVSHEQSIVSDDVRVRASAKWAKWATEAHAIIKNSHFSLRLDDEDTGGIWQDIPILLYRGSKRKLPSFWGQNDRHYQPITEIEDWKLPN